jgi:2',3'-cyclic-nucleotide 2'-phosphodiesterase (5'-nucleotidase family)
VVEPRALVRRRRAGVILAALIGIGSGGSAAAAQAAARAAPGESTRVVIAFVGSARAALEACGCPDAPLGGAARLSSLVLQARSKARRSLFFDTGGSLADPERPPAADRARAPERLIEVYRRTSLTALNVGWTDTSLGEQLIRLQARSGFPFVSANLRLHGSRPFPPSAVFDGPGGRIGLTGIADDQQPLGPGYSAEDPRLALAAVLADLRASGSRLIVVLSELSSARNQALAAAFPEIDLLLSAHAETENLHPQWQERTLRMETLDRLQYLGLLELQLPKGAIRTRRDLTAAVHGGRAPASGIEGFFDLAPSDPRPQRDPAWTQPEGELWVVAIPIPVTPRVAEDPAIRDLLGPAPSE